MDDAILNMLIPYLEEEYCPKRIYAFEHPSFQGSGYKAYRTLLIVIGDESQEPFCRLQERTEALAMGGYGYLFCFQKWGTLANTLNAGQLYYSLVCQRKNLVYAKGHQKLEMAAPERLRQAVLKAEVDFATCMDRITAFLDGARFYEDKGHFPMAAFMLQQSIELLFRGAELALRGGEERCHLIRKHFAPCKPMLPRMCAAFPLITDTDEALLQVLNDAYLNVRYRDQYIISEKDFQEALARASEMIAIAPKEVAAMLQLAKTMVKERSQVKLTNHEDTNQ